jgi:hypothetical protein
MAKSIEKLQKLHRLFHELTQATNRGKLSWEDTADDEEFRAVLKPGMVRIGRRVALYDDGESSRYFAVTLLNREGRIAEEFDSRESSETEMFAELFELARRSALKGDALFDDLLADLEKRLVQS